MSCFPKNDALYGSYRPKTALQQLTHPPSLPPSPAPLHSTTTQPASAMTTMTSTRRHFSFRHHHPPSLVLLLLLAASLLLRSASFALGTSTTRPFMSAVRDALASSQKALHSQALVQSLLG